MEPIKVEVAVSVNVDLSQGTKDFLLKVLERKIEAAQEANESLKESLEPIKAALGMAGTTCNCAKELPEIADAIPSAVETMVQKASEAGKAAAAETVKEEKPGPSKEEQKSAKTVSIEDVRGVLTTKVNDHREAIRAKLNEFGAKSVTTLDPSKYNEMYEFLKSL